MKEATLSPMSGRATFNLANVDNYIDKITELTEGECGTRVSEITHQDNYQRVTVNNVTDSIVQKGRENVFEIQAPARNESNRQSLKLERGRKDADQEFFQMTLISQIMNHEKQKQLIEMQSHHEQLFKKCVATGQPFYTWHDWISNHISGQVQLYHTFRKNRLSMIFKKGKDLLIERVDKRSKASNYSKSKDFQFEK